MEALLKRELGCGSVKATGHSGGGCISQGQSYDTDRGRVFVKVNPKAEVRAAVGGGAVGGQGTRGRGQRSWVRSWSGSRSGSGARGPGSRSWPGSVSELESGVWVDGPRSEVQGPRASRVQRGSCTMDGDAVHAVPVIGVAATLGKSVVYGEF